MCWPVFGLFWRPESLFYCSPHSGQWPSAPPIMSTPTPSQTLATVAKPFYCLKCAPPLLH